MCQICRKNSDSIYKTAIHIQNYEPLILKLCYQHDVELFKKGQLGFIQKYHSELHEFLKTTAKPLDHNIDEFDLKFT